MPGIALSILTTTRKGSALLSNSGSKRTVATSTTR